MFLPVLLGLEGFEHEGFLLSLNAAAAVSPIKAGRGGE